MGHLTQKAWAPEGVVGDDDDGDDDVGHLNYVSLSQLPSGGDPDVISV